MVDMDWKRKMVSSELGSKLHVTIPSPFKVPVSSPISCSDPSACSAYELYLRLPELRKIWSSRDFPKWNDEPILKPALQALEITFRLISAVCSDTRPYNNHREWNRRLDSLVTDQIQLIAAICEEEEVGEDDRTPPLGDGRSSLSLLPHLATWRKSEALGRKILSTIDNEMRRCKYTLGLGEQNIAGKPNLRYDAVCRPKEIYSLKDNPYADHIDNEENQTLYVIHQILESWIHASGNLLTRVDARIEEGRFGEASGDVFLVERIWKLMAEIEDLHVLMDPEDFLKLKKQLQIRSNGRNDAFCFRSRGLVETTRMTKDLREKVPAVVGVEVDPTGGPRLQEAVMRLYATKGECDKIHLLQGMQAVEAAAKRFFFAYKQLVAVVMGSAETSQESCDSLSQIFMEPTYFPSLDAAKTFLGEFWSHLG
ncbi:Nematode resistance protein-like HSPRO2 [Raphanus sativus]|uniref:Nematode resistance protein-like HSPRO2 n=1 Tax=Raphanus sativus TaxID=3726 RepID=A0A6J0MXQ6_RAPSA|nr:nematode resistance protein-like HSPRO2 [Raphanus sativus]KAJ4906737.1 Nematode resistance protein-like HSPRO2 [Raphanus sativus]